MLRYFAPAICEAAGKNKYPLAHPLLVYAELVAEGSERALEAAEVVREQFLGGHGNDD